MKVVLDTNCFISCIGKKSRYGKVFDAFLNKQFILCVSTEILLEYEEKFSQFWGPEIANNLLGVILTAENISVHSIYFNFHLVIEDDDDNKFSDVYFSSNADILVSNDAVLRSLKRIEYPLVSVLSLEEFMNMIIEKK